MGMDHDREMLCCVHSDCCRVPDKMVLFKVSEKSVLTVEGHMDLNETMLVN